MTIAIIGAGMAGLSAACALNSAGKAVRLFDKGRGAGGRMSTRRVQTEVGECTFDHGAQYFTARSDTFRAEVARWEEAGACASWQGRLRTAKSGMISSIVPSAHPRFVGLPGMSGIIRHMAEGLDVSWSKRAARIEGRSPALQVVFEDGSAEGPFEAVLVAVPAEQAVDLLEEPATQLAMIAARVSSAPCWAVMLSYASPRDAGFDGIRIEDGPISWAAHNGSKPRRGGAATFVLHGAPEWSRVHLEDDAEDVTRALTEAFCALTGLPQPTYSAAHRWRYAQVETPVGDACLWDDAVGIAACGDWCIGPRVEAAWESGQAAARVSLR